MKTKKDKNKANRVQKKKEADEAIARVRVWALNHPNKRERKSDDEVKKRRNLSKNTKMVKYEGNFKNEDEELKKAPASASSSKGRVGANYNKIKN